MRVSITIPDELDTELETFAERERIPKPEAFRRALNLIKIANREHAKGRSLGVVVDEGNKLTAVALLTGV